MTFGWGWTPSRPASKDMDQLPALWPHAGDVVIIKRLRDDGFEIAVCPYSAQMSRASYDSAWTTARELAEATSVDFWYTNSVQADGDHDGLRLLGHYRGLGPGRAQ